jgi:hypothetical protein
MLAAIDLDDQVQFAAQEIADERANRHLPREFPPAELAVSEMAPQDALGGSGVVAQALRSASGSPRGVGHVQCMPTPYPSRKREGGF